VVSPNNFKDDYDAKRNLYERIGVQGYWIVNSYLCKFTKYANYLILAYFFYISYLVVNAQYKNHAQFYA
jgi:Uma2 family endonuclease